QRSEIAAIRKMMNAASRMSNRSMKSSGMTMIANPMRAMVIRLGRFTGSSAQLFDDLLGHVLQGIEYAQPPGRNGFIRRRPGGVQGFRKLPHAERVREVPLVELYDERHPPGIEILLCEIVVEI